MLINGVFKELILTELFQKIEKVYIRWTFLNCIFLFLDTTCDLRIFV